MITGLYLMCSEDTRFQSACYSAGMQVVGKLRKQCNACILFQSSQNDKHVAVVQYYSLTCK